MELNDKKNFLKKGKPKGVNLQELIQLINSYGVTFSMWEKCTDGKGSGKMDWTSLMGDKKKLLRTLPEKLESSSEVVIHQDMAGTVIKLLEGEENNFCRIFFFG